MSRLRIDLAYDGAPYAGFARQPDQTTVQGVLEDALSRVLRHAVETFCAGRTDRGVHALAQVVHCDVDPTEPQGVKALGDLAVLRERIDRMVGDAITVWSITEVDTDFDARFSAIWRSYRYRLVSLPADPRTRHVAWHVGPALEVTPMHEAVQHVVGEHDYAAFCRKAPFRHSRRRIDEAAVVRAADGEIHVTLRGKAFCHQMVRSITGCLVEVGRQREDPQWVGKVLAARDRSLAGPVAPPHGLTLEGVGYESPFVDAPHHC